MIRADSNSEKNRKSSGNFPYGHFLAMIGGKWKPYLLMVIYKKGSVRFNEIVKRWCVSSKVLSQQLKELEKDGFVRKISGSQNNLPRTDYLLTEDGECLIPILKEIYKWGLEDMTKKGLYIDPRSYDYL